MTTHAIGSAQEHLPARLELLEAETDLTRLRGGSTMLHPALARALATARIEDQLRAAARWRTIRLARRVARESRVAAPPTAGQRSTSTPTHVHVARPGRRHETNRDCSSSRMAMAIRSRRPLRAESQNRSGIEIVMSPLPMLRPNARIGGSDSTLTTVFASPRRCRFRTRPVT